MTDYIGYEALTQAAMRGVVREALRKGYNSNGLPGDHHFYLTFRTKAPGVKIADYLVERFPEEMTIVIQHQYWDLEVEDSHFEIILKFSGVPQHLHIPYAAITQFVDPAVDFGLQFQATVADMAPAPTEHPDNDGTEQAVGEAVEGADDGSNVVTVDFGRKK